jgi:hypothetical protein
LFPKNPLREASGKQEKFNSENAASQPVLDIGVTDSAGIRVVVQYIGERPARMNENFKILAIEALRAAWPCPR